MFVTAPLLVQAKFEMVLIVMFSRDIISDKVKYLINYGCQDGKKHKLISYSNVDIS